MISVQYINEAVEYDSELGLFHWKRRPVEHFTDKRSCNSWNTKYAGRLAGTIAHGYRIINLNGKLYRAHRLIFLIEHGYIPDCIDHINGDKDDNRISNLREVTESQNMMNRPVQKNNKTGLKGVSLHSGGLWRARIVVNRKEYSLGLFKTKELAHAAYCKAATHYHGEFKNIKKEWETRHRKSKSVTAR